MSRTGRKDEAVATLFTRATRMGVETGYWDVGGTWHDASVESVLAVVAALGAPVDALDAARSEQGLTRAAGAVGRHALEARVAPVEPVVAAVGPEPLTFGLCLAGDGDVGRVRVELTREDGGRRVADHVLAELDVIETIEVDGRRWTRRSVPVPGGSEGVDCSPDSLPIGYHELAVEHGRESHGVRVLAAPNHVHQLGETERLWGAVAPVYALRRAGGLGPHLGDLDALGAWLDRHGGQVVATLPMLSAYLGHPCEVSPYSPVSRRFWNEVYLDVERLPELAVSPEARAWLDRPETIAEIRALHDAPRFDAARQARLVTQVLDELAVTFFAQTSRGAPGFDRWVAEHPLATDYARFRAVAERQAQGWQHWPERLQAGRIEATDYDLRVAARHVYAQWAMDRQLAELAESLSTRDQLLYLDLPVGAGADGFDTWIDRDAYAWGTAVGAPPDAFFAGGQNWGFPPLRPADARAEGHRHLAECLRHHMAHAGMLRLDHVMGLHRLFFVPDGMPATDGAYVQYAADEQFAVVAIESVRAGCVVVGEDLGTVPTEVREAMDRHRVLRSYVAEFSMPEGPGHEFVGPDHRTVASVDTHDTPTFAAFVAGLDLRDRRDQGRLSADAADRALADRRRACDGLADVLAARGLGDPEDPESASLLGGLLALLAGSDSPALLVALDDLVGETEPQNVPGTGPERPNWVLRLPADLHALAADPAIARVLDDVQSARLASYARACTTAAARQADHA